MSFDHLQQLIKARKTPVAVELDPTPECIPPHLLRASLDKYGESLEAYADAACRFGMGLIDALADALPAAVLSVPFYERLGWQGMLALEKTIRFARSKGLFVIADARRGDVGSAALACAQAWLGAVKVGSTPCPAFAADCVTVNGYLGSDAIEPFLEVCRGTDKCFFTLVKAGNPSAGEFQDMVAGDRVVYQVMGDLTARLGREDLGKFGYSRAGAVVATPYPSDLRALRKRLEHTFFLVPALDAPAEDLRFAFDKYGRGAVISVSRPILRAWQQTGHDGQDYQDAARAAAEALQKEFKQYITIL